MSYHFFDQSLDMFSFSFLDEFSDFMFFNTRITNRSLSAEPGVPGLTPPTGQSLPLHHSVSTNVNPIRFQSNVGGPVSHGSGYAHPNHLVSS